MTDLDRWLGSDRHPALLVSECQNGLINPEHATTMAGLAQQAEERNIVGKIAALADAFRAADLPVAHATIEPAEGYEGFDVASPLAAVTVKRGEFRAGTPLPDIHPGLTPQAGDLRFPRRTAMTSFFRSGLGAALRERGVDTVVLVGISVNIAIPGTAVEAVNRGLPVVIPEDATAATTAEVQEVTFRTILPALATITTSQDVIEAIARR
ncbi:nicotinamidase-related amidase [Nocardioides marinisabuli]|uniref:Nicotinamidase-related amidase n=1 Tax=Nocardioides marinisabuli TaxID=419476 RepID=A0A7Y9F0K9_9ACTN|nr:cysteine hydrolase [Nocardioides marinisabuli]NYD57166.1 nicotinamidase-related amidase [Nocardioides marinisabuli]